MFGLFSKKDEIKKPFSAPDSQAENIPIHTMARDIESLNHPEKEGDKDTAHRPEPKVGELQKNSPFLNKQAAPALSTPPIPKPKLESFAKPVTYPLSKDSFTSDPTKTDSDTIIGDVPTGDRKKKLIAVVVIILLITATAAGGYYFLSTRKSTPEEETNIQKIINEESPEVLSGEGENSTANQSASIFSATEKNYFMLDLGGDALISFKGMIGSYYQKIVDSNITYPVEFTVISTENSPISFQTFVQALGIKFSPEMMSAMEDRFNLYIYNDQGIPGVGLVVEVKGEMNPEDILLREEANLPGEFEPLFPVSPYTIEKNKSFATSAYDSARWGKIGIRFQNIISPENLSVDYSFVNTGANMLFMSTTRSTLRSIIENVKPPVTAP